MRVDAAFFGSPLAVRLQDELGWAGPTLWLAFLAACKRSFPQGQISFVSDADALAQMGLGGLPLVNARGEEQSLETFWTLLGRTKNVRRTSRGHVVNVRATHWEQWQDTEQREDEREKKRRQRAKNKGDNTGTRRGQVSENVPLENEKEKEKEIPPHTPPPRGANKHASLNDETATAEALAAPTADAEPVNLAAAVKAALPAKPAANGRRPAATEGIEAEP